MFTLISFRDFRQQYPGFLPGLVLVLAVLLSADALLLQRQANYDREVATLRARMTEVQRQRGDALADTRGEQARLQLELVRRRAKWATALHLALDVDSAKMYLIQEGAILRAFPVVLGVERRLRSRRDSVAATVPRGAFTVDRVLGASDAWAVPRWVYSDRRLTVPADSMVPGALGPVAIILDGGTIVYSAPASGPLRDTAYVLPGGVRASAADLRAVVPNLTPGTSVYVY